jgi:hypothetical protein
LDGELSGLGLRANAATTGASIKKPNTVTVTKAMRLMLLLLRQKGG